jgi:hypothetical protein
MLLSDAEDLMHKQTVRTRHFISNLEQPKKMNA